MKNSIRKPTALNSLFYLTLIAIFTIAGNSQVHAQNAPTNEIFTVVDEVPQYYENGIDGLIKFLGAEIKYPGEARKNKIQGTVFVSFIVEKDGTVSNVLAEKGVEASLDNEAIRVAKQTKWIPGKQNGKAVRVQFVLPVKYTL